MYTKGTLLALAASVAAIPAPDTHIPLNGARLAPRADGTVDFEKFLTHINDTLKKYNSASGFLPSLSHYKGLGLLDDVLDKRASSIPLIDQGNDLLYYGDSVVGASSPQTFTTDFDTGSSDFFVPGPNCPTCHGTPYDQGGVNRHKMTSVTYGSGQVSGNDYFDTVCVAGLCAKKTNVISLTSAQGFSTSKSSSLMGMGFSTIANSGSPTFFENLMSQKKVSTPEFSFFLGRNEAGGGGQLTIGGRDKSKYTGKVTTHKVTQKGYWQLAIDGADVSGGTGLPNLLEAGQAAIDTGTTVIIAPTIAATNIAAAFGAIPLPIVATGSPTETAFAIPCKTTSTIALVFDNKSYAIKNVDLNIGQLTSKQINKLGLPVVKGGLCAFSIIAADLNPGEELYVVGDTFLKNWYSIYSYANGGTVSFAKSKD